MPDDAVRESTSAQADAGAKEDAIQEALDRVFAPDREAQTTPEADDAPRSEPQQDQTATEPQPTPEAEPTQEAPATLDPALRHAARRAGWTNEDIDRFYQANPELANQTFSKLHASYNDLSRRYAQLGAAPAMMPATGPANYQAAPQAQAQAQAQARTQAQPPDTPLDALFSDEALREFAENNGQDIVDRFLRPLYREVIEPFRQMQQWYQGQVQEALGREVELTFRELGQSFPDLYGKDGTPVSAEQREVRFQVAQMADQIRAGAALHGIYLSAGEALERAHHLLYAERLAEQERKRLTSQVRQRASRQTVRPTQRQGTGRQQGQKSWEAAAEAYARRAAELGIDVE